MKRMHWFAVALVGVTVVGSVDAQANRISEVVGARANARAGGPLTDHDAWLLERYGALSGTPGYSNGYKKRSKRRHRRSWRLKRGYRY